MTQLVAGGLPSAGHQFRSRPVHHRPHQDQSSRFTAPQTHPSGSAQVERVEGRSMNGPISLLVKAALKVEHEETAESRRNHTSATTSADQPHPAIIAPRVDTHPRPPANPHPYAPFAHEHPHPSTDNRTHQYGQYPDIPLPRHTPVEGAERTHMPHFGTHHNREPREDDNSYASHQSHNWVPPGPPPNPHAYDYHQGHEAATAPPQPYGYTSGYREPHPYPHPSPRYHHDAAPWQAPPPNSRRDWHNAEPYYHRPHTALSSQDRELHGQPDRASLAEQNDATSSNSPQKRYREMSDRSSSSATEERGGSSKTVSSATGSSDEYQPSTKRTRANPPRSTRTSARLRATDKEKSMDTTSESIESVPTASGDWKGTEDGDVECGGEDEEEDDDAGGDCDAEIEADEEGNDSEEKPKPKQPRRYIRRDLARRKEQNAQAQKKFRQKKKQLAEQMKADLENAQARITELEKEIADLRSSQGRCPCCSAKDDE